MSFSIKGATRHLISCVQSMAVGFLVVGVYASPSIATAQTNVSYSSQPLIVNNDRGGLLRERLREISQLRQQSRPVEIRGAVCFSTCTMFLGLPNTCISPDTTFGFHGPSSYGRTLDPDTFSRASLIIASHYPAPLKDWYMNRARYKIHSVYRVKGENIIRMGVRAC
jgi:hypothetical protein